MRIAVVSPVVPHPRPGLYRSIERIVREDVARLRARGHDLEIVTTFWNGGESFGEFLGVPVRRVEDSSQRVGRLGRLFDRDYETFGHEAGRLVESMDVDVVLSFSRLSSTARLVRRGIPVCSYFYHKDRVSGPMDILRVPFENRHNARDYAAASRILAISEHSAEVAREAWGIPAEKFRVIDLGVDVPAVGAAGAGATKDHDVLFVGTFIPRKGVDVLLQAARRMPREVTIHFVGGGPLAAAIARQAAEGVGARLEVQPPVPSDEGLWDLYRRAKVVVLPSREEGFGLVVAEAMACRTPVVASRLPTLIEIAGEAGVFVEPGDAEGLARGILDLLASPEKARALAERGDARIRSRFTWERHTDALEKALGEVAGRADAPR